MPSERRLERINEVIRRVVGQSILELGNLPPTTLITITKVSLSDKMESVDVYFSVFPDKDIQRAEAFLKRERIEFQSRINEALKARRTPRIRFILDDSVAKVEEMFSQGL